MLILFITHPIKRLLYGGFDLNGTLHFSLVLFDGRTQTRLDQEFTVTDRNTLVNIFSLTRTNRNKKIWSQQNPVFISRVEFSQVDPWNALFCECSVKSSAVEIANPVLWRLIQLAFDLIYISKVNSPKLLIR